MATLVPTPGKCIAVAKNHEVTRYILDAGEYSIKMDYENGGGAETLEVDLPGLMIIQRHTEFGEQFRYWIVDAKKFAKTGILLHRPVPFGNHSAMGNVCFGDNEEPQNIIQALVFFLEAPFTSERRAALPNPSANRKSALSVLIETDPTRWSSKRRCHPTADRRWSSMTPITGLEYARDVFYNILVMNDFPEVARTLPRIHAQAREMRYRINLVRRETGWQAAREIFDAADIRRRLKTDTDQAKIWGKVCRTGLRRGPQLEDPVTLKKPFDAILLPTQAEVREWEGVAKNYVNKSGTVTVLPATRVGPKQYLVQLDDKRSLEWPIRPRIIGPSVQISEPKKGRKRK
jgi:hypothetical protein